MLKSKTDYEFFGPYEVVRCLDCGRFELEKMGASVVTQTPKEQLRRWPTNWSCN